MQDVVRWGIIGCGNVTEVKSGPALQKVQGSELVAVMRRNGKLAQDYAQRHGVPNWYDDAQALVDDPRVNAVYIATPPSSHLAYTRMAAAAGKPVYVEKPMARTHEECLQMIEACEQAGVKLFAAYYRRRLPRFLRVEQLIREGALGDVRMVRVSMLRPPEIHDTVPWRLVPEIAGAGLFLDLASHLLDALDYILGPIQSVYGLADNLEGRYTPEDIVSASWQHRSGVMGSGQWCFCADREEDVIEIIGSKASVRWSCFGTEPVQLYTDDQVECYAEETPIHVQLPLIQTVVNDLLGKGVCPSTGESGARTSWVMDQILAGYRERTGQPGAAPDA